MRANDFTKRYYHGSYNKLPKGTVLIPQTDNYEQNWGHTDFYAVLEKYRPVDKLSHKNSVFMVASLDDIDLAGGATDYEYVVEPIGPVQKHDLNWSSEISMLIGDGYKIDSKEVINAATNYWNGTPHFNESVWEYLTPKAKIIGVVEE